VKAVKLSALRQTSKPPVVRCRPSPFSGLWCSSSRQAPTAAGIWSRSALKPSAKPQPTPAGAAAGALVGAADGAPGRAPKSCTQ
jgi:hypothetical protein